MSMAFWLGAAGCLTYVPLPFLGCRPGLWGGRVQMPRPTLRRDGGSSGALPPSPFTHTASGTGMGTLLTHQDHQDHTKCFSTCHVFLVCGQPSHVPDFLSVLPLLLPLPTGAAASARSQVGMGREECGRIMRKDWPNLFLKLTV